MKKRDREDVTGTVSRRDFAKKSVAAGAAAVALPGALHGETLAANGSPTAATAAPNGAAARINPPGRVIGYGGVGAHPSTVASTVRRRYAEGWQPGTTIPAKYYLEEEHYLRDEAFLAESQWMFADHASRIPNAGDYFVFGYGSSDSVIIVRGNDGQVNGFHNVCRHRGSRLCRHDGDAVPGDPRLSVKQLGSSGSSPVFRCPYHA